MSTALSNAICARLRGTEVLTGEWLAHQQALAALLGTNKATGQPSVQRGNKSAVVAYPAITFRQSAGMPNPHYTQSQTAIDAPIYDFEIWDDTRRGNIITDIFGHMEHLIDGRFGGPPLPVDPAAGQLYWATAFVTLIEDYDSKLTASYGLCRFRFVEARF